MLPGPLTDRLDLLAHELQVTAEFLAHGLDILYVLVYLRVDGLYFL